VFLSEGAIHSKAYSEMDKHKKAIQ